MTTVLVSVILLLSTNGQTPSKIPLSMYSVTDIFEYYDWKFSWGVLLIFCTHLIIIYQWVQINLQVGLLSIYWYVTYYKQQILLLVPWWLFTNTLTFHQKQTRVSEANETSEAREWLQLEHEVRLVSEANP